MNNGVKNSTMRIALCSVIAALGVVIMMLTSLIPIGTYAMPCFAGFFLVAVVIEYKSKWALGVFLVTAILSVFFAGDKEAVLYYIALFGYYPILKAKIELLIKKRVFQYIVKLAVFNISAVFSFFIATTLLSVPLDEFKIFDIYLPYVFLIAGNLFFVLYDFCVTVIVIQYVQKIRTKIFGKGKF